MQTITDSEALDISQRIHACNRYFDPLREHEDHYPEDEISNFSDDMLPYFVSFDERAAFSLYEWINKPPKRYMGLCKNEPYVIDEYRNVLGELAITHEKKIKKGFLCRIRLHSYNSYDYHGTYNTRTKEVHLIANRKFW